LGLSQEQLAELADVSWQTVNSIECRRSWVSDKTLENLARALKIEAFQLIAAPETGEKPALSPAEALPRLLKIKRAFDDQFNAVLNAVK
jgi:transcriptional regulator with XRE-family HTH domain